MLFNILHPFVIPFAALQLQHISHPSYIKTYMYKSIVNILMLVDQNYLAKFVFLDL